LSFALRAVVVSLLLALVSVPMPAVASTHGYGHGEEPGAGPSAAESLFGHEAFAHRNGAVPHQI